LERKFGEFARSRTERLFGVTYVTAEIRDIVTTLASCDKDDNTEKKTEIYWRHGEEKRGARSEERKKDG